VRSFFFFFFILLSSFPSEHSFLRHRLQMNHPVFNHAIDQILSNVQNRKFSELADLCANLCNVPGQILQVRQISRIIESLWGKKCWLYSFVLCHTLPTRTFCKSWTSSFAFVRCSF
jgi:hypothetical protein